MLLRRMNTYLFAKKNLSCELIVYHIFAFFSLEK